MKHPDLAKINASTKNPFKVPDGYFDNLTANIMSSIPEIHEKTAKTPAIQNRFYTTYLRPIISIAAVFSGLILGVGIYHSHSRHPANNISASNSEAVSNETLEAFCDYARIESNDIYIYLSENKQ